MSNTIKIKGVEYELRNTLRSLFLFEELTGREFKIETLRDNYTFYYCIVAANNPDTLVAEGLTFDDFIDACDEDPTLFRRIGEILTRQEKVEKGLNAPQKPQKEGAKKKS